MVWQGKAFSDLLPSIDNDEKEQTQRAVSDIGEDVIERRQRGKLTRAEKIEIAQIFVARRIDVQLILQNKLNDGQRIEDRDRDHRLRIDTKLLPQILVIFHTQIVDGNEADLNQTSIIGCLPPVLPLPWRSQ